MIILHFQNLVQMNCSPLPTDIQQERLHPTFTIPCLPPPHYKYPILYLVLSPYL